MNRARSAIHRAGWAIHRSGPPNERVALHEPARLPARANVFGENSPVLADFGFTPPPRKAVLTPDQKVAKAEKALATRKAPWVGNRS
jgi:hypothetical protein